MRVVKLIEKSPIQNDEGDWLVFAQVYMGNDYQYGAIVCDTLEEANEIKEGQILDIEKVRFSHRTRNA